MLALAAAKQVRSLFGCSFVCCLFGSNQLPLLVSHAVNYVCERRRFESDELRARWARAAVAGAIVCGRVLLRPLESEPGVAVTPFSLLKVYLVFVCCLRSVVFLTVACVFAVEDQRPVDCAAAARSATGHWRPCSGRLFLFATKRLPRPGPRRRAPPHSLSAAPYTGGTLDAAMDRQTNHQLTTKTNPNNYNSKRHSNTVRLRSLLEVEIDGGGRMVHRHHKRIHRMEDERRRAAPAQCVPLAMQRKRERRQGRRTGVGAVQAVAACVPAHSA